MVELSGIPVHEILYIGDDMKKDILPAKKVGMKTGILWTASADAGYSFLHFEEIIEWLDGHVGNPTH